MKVLVTGVKGQLGYDVMNELAKRGYEGVGKRGRQDPAGVEREHLLHDTKPVGECNRPHCGACHYLRPMRGAYQHGNGKEQSARH